MDTLADDERSSRDLRRTRSRSPDPRGSLLISTFLLLHSRGSVLLSTSCLLHSRGGLLLSTSRLLHSTGGLLLSTSRLLHSRGGLLLSTSRLLQSTGGQLLSTDRLLLSTDRLLLSTSRLRRWTGHEFGTVTAWWDNSWRKQPIGDHVGCLSNASELCRGASDRMRLGTQ